MVIERNFPQRPSDYWHQLGSVLTVAILLLLYLPRLLTVGAFIDGTTYAALARNMAVGYGAWWSPRYGEADSFWLAEIRGDIFYEHPPLMLILESFFFQLLGDHWWVEELFSGVITLCFFWFVLKSWHTLHAGSSLARFGWLAVGTVGTIPAARFCLTSNYLDGLLLVFLAAGFHQLCRALVQQRISGLYWAGFFLFLGFLTKGPFVVFIASAPVLYALLTPATNRSLWQSIGQAFIPALCFGLLFGLLMLYTPARDFFTHYVEQQILRALNGSRTDVNEVTGSRLGRFYILYALFINLLPLLLFTAAVAIRIRRWRGKPIAVSSGNTIWWLLLIGLGGVVPILASTKQHTHYITSGAVFFGLAVATFLATYLQQWFSSQPTFRFAAIRSALFISTLLLSVVLSYTFHKQNVFTGTPSTTRRNLEQLQSMHNLPRAVVVAVRNKALITGDLYLNMGLQRFHRIALTADTTKTPYLLSSVGDAVGLDSGYDLVENLPDYKLQLWRRRPVAYAQRVKQ